MSKASGTDLSALDSRMLLYLPNWARRLAVLSLVLLLTAAILWGVYLLQHQQDVGDAGVELFIWTLSIVQTSAIGLVFVLILFYSRRDANMGTLMRHSDEFLKRHMKQALARISVPSLGISSFTVRDGGAKDVFGHLFVLESAALNVRIWIGLNVHRLFVIYFISRDGSQNFTARAQEIFKFTFGGAERVGFVPHYEEAEVDGEPILSIWLTASTASDLLTNPSEKLFWSQDIAMMTESFIRTALRNRLNLMTVGNPAPL